jgi:dTDP-4-amino-4,6-dideoxygalactose transaminase
MKDKLNVQDLAIFGGQPAFATPLHVGRPNIGDRAKLLTRINDILDRRWLSNNGPYVQELEQRIADTLGVKHCVAMANGTIALEIAIRALDLAGEVIVPSMTFVATAHALQWQQITPVFCDIGRESLTLDPSRVEERITARTTAIMGVHLWGRVCDVERLAEIGARRNLRLLFDASHAFHVSHRGQTVGTFGDAEVFSFHATKFFNTFEGGAVVTNDDALAAKMRLMKNFGFSGYDNVIHVGTNGKMPEISAAMGLTGLDSLDHFIAVNYRNYKQYERELSGLEGVRLLNYDEAELANYQYIVLDIDEARAGISRDTLATLLSAENVLARRYFYPGCHRMEPYRTLQPEAGKHLPVTEAVVARMLTLPTGTAISAGEVRRICQVLRFLIEHAGQVQSMLSPEYAYA